VTRRICTQAIDTLIGLPRMHKPSRFTCDVANAAPTQS
jgi:hypothetical protein